MTLSIPTLILTLFAAGAALASAAAQAADSGACAAPDAMTAALKAEGQRSIASAQMITGDKRLFGMIFTMNADRSVGYILKADQPLGDRAGEICVYNRMANIRLFDARKAGTPAGALLKAPEADASRRCDELAAQGKVARKACGALNTILQKTETYGERVLLQGFLVERASDGSYRPDGTLATLSGRVGGSINDFRDSPARGILGGLAYSSLPEGATILNATLVYVEYTPYGLTALP
jgi:hypothetical protein